jgi:hypothetical protein
MTSSINRGILTRIGADSGLSGMLASFTAAVADLWAGVANSLFVTPQVMRLALKAQTLVDGANIAWDMNRGFRAIVTLLASGHKIMNPTNLYEGATGSLQIKQDGTGGRTIPANSTGWDTGWDFGAAGYPTLSTGANKTDVVFWEVIDATTPVIKATFHKAA